MLDNRIETAWDQVAHLRARTLAFRKQTVSLRKQLLAYRCYCVRCRIRGARHRVEEWQKDRHRLSQRLEILQTLQQGDASSQDETSLTRAELTKSTEFVKNFYINHEMKSLPENHMVLFPLERASKYLQKIFRDDPSRLRK